MNAIRTLALAAVAGAGAAANARLNGTPQGEVIEMLPRADRDGNCAELPKLCTGAAVMFGHATTVTYLCPEITKTRERSTVHVTITKTTTVTPPQAEPTDNAPSAPNFDTPAPVVTKEPDTTTTIRSTLTKYKTITIVRSSGAPVDVAPPSAVSITDYLSATIPTELIPLPTETEDPEFTILTSTNPDVTPTSAYNFPTMSLPVVNSTTTGIFYSVSAANSSFVQPTAFYPNTTSGHPHYSVPTLNVEHRAAENQETATGAAGKLGATLSALAFGVAVIAFAV